MSTHTITAPIPTYAHRALHRSWAAPAPVPHNHNSPSPPARPVHRPRTTRSVGREGQEQWFECHPLHHPAPRRVSNFAVHLRDVIDMIDKDPGESEEVGEGEGEGKKMSDFETPAGSPAESPVFRTSSSSSLGFVSRPSQLGLTSVVLEEEEAGGVEAGVSAERKDVDVAGLADTEPEAVTGGGKAVQSFENPAPRVPPPPRLSVFKRRAATLPSTPQFLASRQTQTQTQTHRPHTQPSLSPLPTRPIFEREAFKTTEDKIHNYIKHYQTHPWTEMEEGPDYFLFGWRNEVIASWNRFYSKENEAKRREARGSVSLPG
ncbi:hypothetical protein L198_06268 [Cryptococcus wingfieldii CBS 7118]|uniref:Uncharacterized protein n=1 Tax=Cryptococcus wingfieldii CBS 7118 TaxID=1295528 RepID=A0A1E3INR4_9TREE|nr:hypothetical protein L198_06268 [Cryptococcus wingfieldii CBS 7118]ODN90250.1 hypothetical protein L198_06268 [Cryptococcus wingfieldii CBS 7118]